MRLILAAIVAFVIGVAIVWSRTKSSGEPPLPDFTLQSFGGIASTRAGDTRVLRPLQVDTTARVELPLTPASPVTGSIEFRVLLERPNGDVVVPVEVINADRGAYRLTVAGPEITGTPLGDASLVAFAARAGVLSNDAAALKAMESSSDVRVLRQPITVVASRR
jgi:hypothetical protein